MEGVKTAINVMYIVYIIYTFTNSPAVKKNMME